MSKKETSEREQMLIERCRQKRIEHRELGLCTECKAKATQGSVKCIYHREKSRKYHLERRKSQKEQGLCLDCKEKALSDNCRCEFHREHHLNLHRKSTTALRKIWKISNKCIRCGTVLNPEMDEAYAKCLNCRLESNRPFKKSDFKFLVRE